VPPLSPGANHIFPATSIRGADQPEAFVAFLAPLRKPSVGREGDRDDGDRG
jgi:hypothetical protein